MTDFSNADFLVRVEREHTRRLSLEFEDRQSRLIADLRLKRAAEEVFCSRGYLLASADRKLVLREGVLNHKLREYM